MFHFWSLHQCNGLYHNGTVCFNSRSIPLRLTSINASTSINFSNDHEWAGPIRFDSADLGVSFQVILCIFAISSSCSSSPKCWIDALTGCTSRDLTSTRFLMIPICLSCLSFYAQTLVGCSRCLFIVPATNHLWRIGLPAVLKGPKINSFNLLVEPQSKYFLASFLYNVRRPLDHSVFWVYVCPFVMTSNFHLSSQSFCDMYYAPNLMRNHAFSSFFFR